MIQSTSDSSSPLPSSPRTGAASNSSSAAASVVATPDGGAGDVASALGTTDRTWRAWLVENRLVFLLAIHAVVFMASYEAAYRLRFDWSVPSGEREFFWRALPFVVLIKLAAFYWLGNIHGWWRYVTFSDFTTLFHVSSLSLFVLGGVNMLAGNWLHIPRTVLILDWGATLLFLGGLRSAWRLVREEWLPAFVHGDRRPTLMVGRGREAARVAQQINNHRELQLRIVGFLATNRSDVGTRLASIPFLGAVEQAVDVAKGANAHQILVLGDSLSGDAMRRLTETCREAAIHVRVIPHLERFVDGSFRLELREVNIDDLLRRDPVQLDQESIAAMVRGKSVLVTGAGGSIGSEIARQLLARGPARLILVERAENNLFRIEQELLALRTPVELQACVADIGDKVRLKMVFDQHRPELVFHAAAHKHVPLMELNPGEAIKNNVFGTVTLVDVAQQSGVERFVMISTDKAVNPTSIMGVSKQLAERYVHAAAEEGSTRFVAVRFGNVLASSGSVVPIFQEQIRRGGPVTVTHPDMRRYFMTIPEAAQLVLQAAAMGKGGEIFVLEMGEPVRILDLAQDLIRLSGFTPEQIQITFSGIRPGEKLYEDLYLHDERTLPTPHPKLRVAYHRPYTLAEVRQMLRELAPLLHSSPEPLRAKLMELTPEFRPGPAADGSAPELPARMPSLEAEESPVSPVTSLPK